ncbi:MAG: metal ABC transporter permease [Candidatus Heimdallarchaeota archaeon]|nr:metal ABC transporter permease [Candidatus Heimdallarchaeota archaeon]
MASVDDFIESLQYDWMQRAVISAVLIGIICSIIGVFIILRGMIFLGEAIAHSAFAGAALAILLGYTDPILFILIFGIVTAVGVNYINEKKLMNDDVIIGISFTAFMALAILFIGMMDTYSSNVQSILFGRILLITQRNYTLLILFTIVISLTILGLKKELYFISFNEELARTSGISVSKINYIFLILIALAIDVSITAIGAILVFAMLITPAAAAFQWTYKLNRMLILAVTFGVISAFGGLFLSFIYDLPSGATIVLLATSIFIVSFVLSPKQREFKSEELTRFQDDPLAERTPHFHLSEHQSTEEFKEHIRDKTNPKLNSEVEE